MSGRSVEFLYSPCLPWSPSTGYGNAATRWSRQRRRAKSSSTVMPLTLPLPATAADLRSSRDRPFNRHGARLRPLPRLMDQRSFEYRLDATDVAKVSSGVCAESVPAPSVEKGALRWPQQRDREHWSRWFIVASPFASPLASMPQPSPKQALKEECECHCHLARVREGRRSGHGCHGRPTQGRG